MHLEGVLHAKRNWSNWPVRSCCQPSMSRPFGRVVTAIAPGVGRWRRSAPSPSPCHTASMAPWSRRMSKASATLWTIRDAGTGGGCGWLTGPCSTCSGHGGQRAAWPGTARASLPPPGRPKAVRGPPASPMALCPRRWTWGVPRSARPTVAAQPYCAALRMLGAAPSALRTPRHGFPGGARRGE